MLLLMLLLTLLLMLLKFLWVRRVRIPCAVSKRLSFIACFALAMLPQNWVVAINDFHCDALSGSLFNAKEKYSSAS